YLEGGAGDGNRTHGSSLGSLGITIIRRPLPRLILVAFQRGGKSVRISADAVLGSRKAKGPGTSPGFCQFISGVIQARAGSRRRAITPNPAAAGQQLRRACREQASLV